MDNDSADVTSSGRSFYVHGSTTGKTRLATVVIYTKIIARRDLFYLPLYSHKMLRIVFLALLNRIQKLSLIYFC